MRARVLLDTGPLVAMLSRRDAQHERCVGTMREVAAPLLTCWPVITEAAWLLRHQPAAVWRMLEGFHAGWLTPLQLDEHAGEALARIMRRYQKLGAQLADAALLYLQIASSWRPSSRSIAATSRFIVSRATADSFSSRSSRRRIPKKPPRPHADR